MKWHTRVLGSFIVGISACGCTMPNASTNVDETTANTHLSLDSTNTATFSNFHATRPSVRELRGRSAVRLSDGSVLVIGGFDASFQPTNFVERFDPVKNVWTEFPPALRPHGGSAAFTLSNGKVLLLSAASNPNTMQGIVADLFDPMSRTWAPGMATEMLAQAPPVLLHDGRLLVLGQTSQLDAPRVKALTPESMTWTTLSLPMAWRDGSTAVVMKDGRVLVAGGCDASTNGMLQPLASAELYDPKLDQWLPVSNMYRAQARPRGVLLPNGEVLVIDAQTGATESYDPVGDRWQWRASMPMDESWQIGVNGLASVLSPDGKLFIIGGNAGLDIEVDSWMYDPEGDTWTSLGRLLTPRYGHTATLLNDGNILIAGGTSVFSQLEQSALRNAELYVAPISPWKTIFIPQPHSSSSTATKLEDGRVLLGAWSVDFAQSMLFDPTNDSVGSPASMVQPRTNHHAVLLADGRVLAVGGYTTTEPVALKTTEIFDPATSKWTPGPNLPTPMGQPRVCRLADGRVIAAPMFTEPEATVKSIAVLDSQLKQWTPLELKGIPEQTLLDMIALDPKRVVLLGQISTSAEPILTTIDLGTRISTWLTPSELYSFGQGTLTALLDGRVLVTSHITKSRIGIFDPTQQSWNFLGRFDFIPPVAHLVGDDVIWVGSDSSTPKAGLFDLETQEIGPLDRPALYVSPFDSRATALQDGRLLVTAPAEGMSTALLLYGKKNGLQCTGSFECMSGHCVDGYCCNTACNDSGACQTCSVARGAPANGTCETVAQCAPYQCKELVSTPSAQTAKCANTCARASDCAAGFVCNLDGKCGNPVNYNIPLTCVVSNDPASPGPRTALGTLAILLALWGRRRGRHAA